MGSGCLSPKPRESDIYIEAINATYEEFKLIDVNQSQLYQQLTEQIGKKGRLRKLLQNLSSHRVNICDAAMHSYRLITQIDTTAAYFIGLVIINQIIQSAVSDSSSLPQKSIDGSQLSHKLISVTTQEASKSKKLESSLMITQICSSRFEKIYISLIEMLLDQRGTLQLEAVESLCIYCHASENYFFSEDKTISLLEELLCRIKKKRNIRHLEVILKGYRCVMRKCRTIYKTISRLEEFITIWMSYNKHNSTVSFQAESIIRQYILSAVSTSDFPVIYDMILKIYDSNEFRSDFQPTLLLIVNEHDLKEQFLKGFFTSLLNYISCSSGKMNSTAELSGSKMNSTVKYKQTHENMPSALKMLQTWATQHIQLSQIITYNSSLFVMSFVDKIRSQNSYQKVFMQLVTPLSNQLKALILNVIYGHISESAQKNELIRLANIIFKDYRRCKAELKFPTSMRELNLEGKRMLIEHIENVLSQMNSECMDIHTEQICRFLISITEALLQIPNVWEFSLLLRKCLSLFKLIQTKHSELLILAYLKKCIRCCHLSSVPLQAYLLCSLIATLRQILYEAEPPFFLLCSNAAQQRTELNQNILLEVKNYLNTINLSEVEEPYEYKHFLSGAISKEDLEDGFVLGETNTCALLNSTTSEQANDDDSNFQEIMDIIRR